MGFLEGVGWSLAGAVAHSAIDLLRKLAAARLPPADLVALVTVYDAVIASAGVALLHGGLPRLADVPDPATFGLIVGLTSGLALAARLLYQRALSIAPLSLTVPYLAFTPAFVVLLSPLFLAAEVPSPLGMLGVFIVSISGWLLGLVTTGSGGGSGGDQPPTSPSKLKAPGHVPFNAAAAAALNGGGGLGQQRGSWPGGSGGGGGGAQQQLQQAPLLPPPGPPQQGSWARQQQLQQQQQQQAQTTSVWALAYAPKHKASDAGGLALPAAHVQLVSAAAAAPFDSSGSWADAQAAKAKAGRAAAAAARAAVLLHGAPVAGRAPHGCWRWLVGGGGGTRAPANAGPAMVLAVAAMYSLTASLDKVGIAACGASLSTYFLAQRLLIGAAGLAYLLVASRGSLRCLVRDAPLLAAISLVEQAAVVLYLLAIQQLLVSYVVAIKRVNVLLSTLAGCAFFGERVRQRIPYILVMLGGMLLIVLQPGHEVLHHSHHTLRR